MIDRKSIRFLTFLFFLICSDLPDKVNVVYVYLIRKLRAEDGEERGMKSGTERILKSGAKSGYFMSKSPGFEK